MIKKRNTGMANKSRPAAEPDGDPAETVIKAVQPLGDDSIEKIDNQYEAAGFAIKEIFKNWKKFLILISVILLIIGIILLLLLPGYKCQTKSNSFEKSPVNLPGKEHSTSGGVE